MVTSTGNADPRRWRALWICLVAGFMTLLDVSIVNVALPSMEHGIGATPADVSWVVSGYALTFGLALVPAGRLGDDYGRKRMFLLGLLLFVATSVLCGAAPGATWLVVARLCQGIAGGLLNPQVIGMIQQLFTGRERGKAFGLFGATVGLSTAVGPLLGGLLIQGIGMEQGWRYVFYVNLPIGLLAIAFGMRLLPHDERRGPRRSPDLLGTLLLGLAVVSVMLPLVEAEESTSTPRWWLMGVGAALLVLFVLWERRLGARGRHPLVNLKLLTVRSYSAGALLGMVYFAGFTGIFLVMTLFFQQGLGYSPLEAGCSLLAFAIGSAISPAIGGRIVHRFGRPLVVSGIVLVVLGLGATALLVGEYDGANAALVLAGPLFVAGFGSGFVIAPNQTLALEEVPPAEGGTAAGVLQTGQRVGAAIGTALGGSLFFGQLTRSHGDYHSSAAHGLVGSVVLVGVALLVGLADVVMSARRRKPASPRPVVRGTVVGAPAAVTLTSLRTNRSQRAEVGEDGRFELPVEPGEYLVLASVPGREPAVRQVRVADGPVTADFAFEREVRLSGVVTGPAGPVPFARVEVLGPDGAARHTAVADEAGRYRVEGLPPGEYTVVAAGYAPTASPVRIEGRRTRHDPVFSGSR
ncbi:MULTISPECIES: MFS transporter [Amycolatopsis]|uniref:MFS transporter n=1 Tax=Amycolatopsis TaxID=1813 RepID=UPI0031F857AD